MRPVKTELRVVAVFAALAVARLGAETAPASFPRIVIGDPPPPPLIVLHLDPPVHVAIPEYQLTDLKRETVAACLVLEAASQGEFGMRGVMSVIRNRAQGRPELFAPTVLQKKQFSAFNKLTSGRESLWRTVQRARHDRMWSCALRLVDEAQRDTWRDPTEGATHYTRTGEHTAWTRTLARTVTIGAHSFYR